MSDPKAPGGRGRGRGGWASSNPPAPGLPAPGASSSAETEARGRGRGKAKTKIELDGSKKGKEQESSQHKLVKELVPRPDYGKAGNSVRLFTNWFAIKLDLFDAKKVKVQQYSVNVKYTGNGMCRQDRERRRTVFWEMVRSNPGIFTWDRTVYDDDAIAFTLERLEFPHSSTTHNFDVEVQLFGEIRKRRFTVELNLANADLLVDLSQLGQGYEQKDRLPLQCIDVVLTQSRRCTLPQFARDWYCLNRTLFKIPSRPPGRDEDLGDGKELWTGLFVGASVGQDYKPYVNLDIKHGVFYKDMKCPEFVWTLLNSKLLQLNEGQIHLVRKELKTMKFITEHCGGKRQLKCQDIGPASSDANHKFTYEVNGEEREVTVQEYFKDQYNIELRYPDLPTLVVGTARARRRQRVPMELCYLERPQRYNPSFMSDKIKSQMVKVTTHPPAERKKKTEDLVKGTPLGIDPFAKAFGVQLNETMTELDGRVLDKPHVMQNVRVPVNQKGIWRLENQEFKVPASCECWGFVVMARRISDVTYNKFCDEFVKKCRSKGMKFAPISMDLIRYVDRVDQLSVEFKKLIEFARNSGRNLQLIFVSMPEALSKEIHKEVKRLGDSELGIATQCVRELTVKKLDSNRNPSTLLLQLSLKVNAKLGGVHCSIDDRDPLWLSLTKEQEPTLFLGMDVSHPGVEERRNRSLPSLSAVIGNEDLQATQYGVSFKVQNPCQEQMIHSHDAMQKRLLSFYQKTGVKPARLIVYRDGVSESQFRECLDQELTAIERAVCDLGGRDYNPKVTFVLVQKRHHTRFYPTKPPHPDYSTAGNVPVGTVVDTVITHPRNYDFYLTSHDALKGTARPGHYYVLWDENNFDADTMQALTYRLCFLLQRCSKVVSIPSPTYFAHLAAKRAMELISASESQSSSATESSSLDVDKMQNTLDNVKEGMFFI